MQVIAQTKTLYPSLTKSERKVADFVLEHGGELVHMTLSELARCIGVGEATVVRFCQKIDLGGFQELKFYLELEVDESKQDAGEGPEGIKQNLIDNIEFTYSMLSQGELEQVLDAIHDAEEVFFYGIGTSGLSASMGEARLFRYGKRTRAVTDSHVQMMQSSLCDSSSLLIAVSVSGETKDLVESVGAARSAGAQVVAITSYANSSLAKLADHVFITYDKMSFLEGGTFSSAVSQIYVLDVITTGYALRYSDDVARVQEKIGWSMMSKVNV